MLEGGSSTGCIRINVKVPFHNESTHKEPFDCQAKPSRSIHNKAYVVISNPKTVGYLVSISQTNADFRTD